MSYVNKVKTELRRELILFGREVSEEIEEDGLDPSLFEAVQLNYLSITNTKLKVVPYGIGQLLNLVNLVLRSNFLLGIPSDIGQLINLKHLDISRNDLVELPAEISNLKEIESFNVSFNHLTEIPSLQSSGKLRVLDLSYNQFENFPDILYAELKLLAELKLDSNNIKHIPYSIGLLTSLKIFSVSNNHLYNLPVELGNLKLKDVKFDGNPFTDKNLKKILSTGNTKKIIDYIKKRGMFTPISESSAAEDDNQGNDEAEDLQIIKPAFTNYIRVELSPGCTVVRMEDAVEKRKFILCCIVKNVNFNNESFSKFIRLQNTLHTSCCKDRELASIGTHDFDSLTSKSIIYTCLDPNEIIFKPLGSDTNMSAAVYVADQKSKADKLSKRKKRSSGILKYIHMLDGAQTFPCLMTEDSKQVISLPPVTNCEDSKMSLNTKNILIEVTSQHSQAVCKNVMENLLIELCQLGIGDTASNNGERHYLDLCVVAINHCNGANYLMFPTENDLVNYSKDVQVTFI